MKKIIKDNINSILSAIGNIILFLILGITIILTKSSLWWFLLILLIHFNPSENK